MLVLEEQITIDAALDTENRPQGLERPGTLIHLLASTPSHAPDKLGIESGQDRDPSATPLAGPEDPGPPRSSNPQGLG